MWWFLSGALVVINFIWSFFDSWIIYCIVSVCRWLISYLSLLFLFYFYSENTKNVLIAASFIHLKHREHAKFTSELTTVNPRILLSGPAGVWVFMPYIFFILEVVLVYIQNAEQRYIISCFEFFVGSEIYQEMLAKALANYFGAKLLIFDSHSFLGVRYSTRISYYWISMCSYFLTCCMHWDLESYFLLCSVELLLLFCHDYCCLISIIVRLLIWVTNDQRLIC